MGRQDSAVCKGIAMLKGMCKTDIAMKTFKGKVLVVLLLFLTILFAYFGNTAFIYEQF